MATTRLGIVLALTPLLVSCDARYHLAGGVDAGSTGGAIGAAGRGGANGGGGANGSGAAMGGGGAAAAGGPDAGGTPDASTVAPSPLGISPREALTRVARVLWESPPDEALVALADSGVVTTDEDVRRVALNMLADARSRVGVAAFYRWWLNLDALATTVKDPALFPEYSTSLGTTMAAETEAFALDVTFDGDGHFPSLMRASYSFINEPLASLYGIPGVTGSELRKVDLDPTQRSGILTQLAFLTETSSSTSWTSPTHRGLFVLERILCQPIPAPPGAVPSILVAPPPPQTNRQRLTQTTSYATCRGCHSLMDPLGFAYERFDSIGRVRLTDSGLPIDTSGELVFELGDSSWTDAIDLAQVLASSADAHACMGRQWLRYVLRRELTDTDVGSAEAIGLLFAASGLDLRAVIAAAVSSASFLDPTGGLPCTPGIAQSCNDDPQISSLHGTCTPAGKCECTGTFTPNPVTGRCL